MKLKTTPFTLVFSLVTIIASAQTVPPSMPAAKIKDGGPATAALLNAPSSVKIDAAGNVYIADFSNNRVRKVDAKTGVITTIAGTGKQGFSGDGGPATDAAFKGVSDIALDTAGNIYIADQFNNKIRKVDAKTGIVTTIAGTHMGNAGDDGPATKAQLNNPFGVGVDAAGNVYISDNGNSSIRKIDAKTGIITTIAGDGKEGKKGDDGPAKDAELDKPIGILVTPAGDIYIADGTNCKVRRIDGKTGDISCVAGNGKEGKKGDGGSATAAQLSKPCGVAIDAQGNIYITDEYNFKVRRVDAGSGEISTFAGTGKEGANGDEGDATSVALSGPCGIAVDSKGIVYFTDHTTNLVRKVDTSGDMSVFAGKYVEPKK